MRISRVSRQKRHVDRFNLYVDGEYRLALPAELVIRHGLAPEQEVDERFLAKLAAETAAWRAREAALRLLAHRPRSEQELRQRLLRKSFPPDAIASCLEQLRNSRIIDDGAFAIALARERVRNRPSSRRRLLVELREKGVSEEDATAAVEAALGEDDTTELDLARRAASGFRTRRGEDPVRARRRLFGFLSRRGFTGGVIREIIREQAP